MIQSHRKRTRASTSRAARRATAGLAAIALASTSFALTTPTFATTTVEAPRTFGADRYATSAEVSKATFPTGSTNVVLASGLVFPDGLSASALAGELNAPVLLVPPTGALTDALKTEITRLGATKGFVIGGTAAISAAMEAQLVTAGLTTMTRYAGADRYSTSKAVTAALTGSVGTDNAKATAFLATGSNFADALAASGPAYAAKMPLILTNSFALNANASSALMLKAIKKVIVVGGVNAISASLVTEVEAMGIEVVRFSGASRNDTAAALAAYVAADADYGFTKNGVILTKGTDFADALSAGPHSGKMKHPVLFVESTIPAATSAYLAANASTMATIRLIGGVSAIPESVVAGLKTAAGGTTAVSNQTYTVTPTAAADKAVSTTTSGETNVGRVTAEITVPTTTTSVHLRLVPASSVTVSTAGAVSFSATAALANTAGASMELVNGVAGTTAVVSPATTNTVEKLDVAPINGKITVVLDSVSVQEFVLLAWSDTKVGGVADQLDLDAESVPQDSFGASSTVRYIPISAVSIDNGVDGRVVALDKVAGRMFVDTTGTPAVVADYAFAEADVSYTYDSNDTFSIVGVPVTLAEFNAALSRGDAIGPGAYSTTAGGISIFNIVADGSTAVAAVPTVTNLDVALVITPALPATVARYDSFLVERAPVVSGAIGTYATVATVALTADEDVITGTLTYTNTTPAAGVYSYRVAGIVDGDVGAKFVVGNQTTVAAAADVTPPTGTFFAVVTDTGFAGEGTTGDVIRLILDEPVTVAAGASMRLIDGADITQSGTEESFTLTNGGNASFTTNTSTVSIGATTYLPGRILTVTLNSTPTPGAVIVGGNNTLDWQASLVNSSGFVDAASNALALTGDVLANLNTSAPAITATAGDDGDNTIVLTYASAAFFVDNTATRAQFVYKGATPTAITGNGLTTVTLTFANGLLIAADNASTLTYTQSATTSARVQGLNGKAMTSPATTAAVAVVA